MRRVVVMGVAGSGKSTVGGLLARALGVDFADGDDLHPDANVGKMAAGVPLQDDDRWPWLEKVGDWLNDRPQGAVVACSALKRSYRDVIRAAVPDAAFVHLSAREDVLSARVDSRRLSGSHFMGSAMLPSQLDDLEPLKGDELGVEVDVTNLSEARACEAALSWLETLAAN